MDKFNNLVEEDRSPDGVYIRYNKKLGSGAYKTVYLGYNTDLGIDVAWNEIPLDGIPECDRSRILNETKILHELQHPNIIDFYDVWQDKKENKVVFTTEIVSSGTLKDFAKRSKDRPKLKLIKKWCRQILEVLRYLHTLERPVIHRDLKCDNIFINGNTGELKVGDLGLSTSKWGVAKTVLGTPEFMAPEMYDENYNELIDIYAFGMCVLELCTGLYPYEECINPAQIYKKVISFEKPKALERIIDMKTYTFIEQCIAPASERLNSIDLLRHPFLRFESLSDEFAVSMEPLEAEEIPKSEELPKIKKTARTVRKNKSPVPKTVESSFKAKPFSRRLTIRVTETPPELKIAPGDAHSEDSNSEDSNSEDALESEYDNPVETENSDSKKQISMFCDADNPKRKRKASRPTEPFSDEAEDDFASMNSSETTEPEMAPSDLEDEMNNEDDGSDGYVSKDDKKKAKRETKGPLIVKEAKKVAKDVKKEPKKETAKEMKKVKESKQQFKETEEAKETKRAKPKTPNSPLSARRQRQEAFEHAEEVVITEETGDEGSGEAGSSETTASSLARRSSAEGDAKKRTESEEKGKKGKPPAAEIKRARQPFSLTERPVLRAVVEKDDKAMIFLNLRFDDGKSREVSFPFNFRDDSVHQVAREMADELNINKADTKRIAHLILQYVRIQKKKKQKVIRQKEIENKKMNLPYPSKQKKTRPEPKKPPPIKTNPAEKKARPARSKQRTPGGSPVVVKLNAKKGRPKKDTSPEPESGAKSPKTAKKLIKSKNPPKAALKLAKNAAETKNKSKAPVRKAEKSEKSEESEKSDAAEEETPSSESEPPNAELVDAARRNFFEWSARALAEKKQFTDFLMQDLNQKMLLYYNSLSIFSTSQLIEDLTKIAPTSTPTPQNAQKTYFHHMISQSLAQISTDLPAFESRYSSPISIFAGDFRQPWPSAPRHVSASSLALLLRNTDQYLQILESQRAGLARLRQLAAETLPLLRLDPRSPLKRVLSTPLPGLEAPNLRGGDVARELAGFLSTSDCFDNMSDLTRASFHSVEALVERLERLKAQLAPLRPPGNAPAERQTMASASAEKEAHRFSVRTENALKAELGGRAEGDEGRGAAEGGAASKEKMKAAALADAERSVADAVEAEERLMKPILDFKKNGGAGSGPGDEAKNEGAFVQQKN